MAHGDTWMVCSACRKDIPFGAKYQACSVSTCNRPRTRVVFCSIGCWDSHVVVLRHRDAWAVESLAPTKAEYAANPTAGLPAASAAATSDADDSPPPRQDLAKADEGDILIVMSKMKKYIKERSGMNCSDGVAQGLSDHVRAVCDQMIRNAGADGRKTVLDRDVPRVVRG
jgi:hypothetical protein